MSCSSIGCPSGPTSPPSSGSASSAGSWSPPGVTSPSIWLSLQGSRVSSTNGSIQGKTTYHSSATALPASTREPMILPGRPNGRCRQIHAYMPLLLAPQVTQHRGPALGPGLFLHQPGVHDQPLGVVPLGVAR